MFQYLQHQLDRIAMYRTVTLALLFLVLCSLGASLLGGIAFGVLELILSVLFCVALAIVVNVSFSKALGVVANHESAVITALILFFLFLPPQTTEQWLWLGVGIVIGVASKFLLTWRKQHICNAAALGAVAVSLPYFLEAPWWIATPWLFVPLLIAGAAVVTKIRQWSMVLMFLAVAFVVFMFEGWRFGNNLLQEAEVFLFSWPALFLAFFMLTEPFTMPGTQKKRLGYASLVGFLSSTAIFAPYFAMTPELALVIGNVVMYPFTLRQKLFLALKEKRTLALNTIELIFEKPTNMVFRSGQYLEWMLPHKKSDNRGLRRYFTIASAPEEDVLRLAVRTVSEGSSTYKQALEQLQPGETVIASQRAGDFLLPEDRATKLAFVAGGIGVTPFSSHLSHMQLTNKWFDTTLYYCNNTEAEIAYIDTFSEYAKHEEFTLVNVLAKEEVAGAEHGYLTAEIITRQTPDYRERTWYLSGPPGMVNAYSKLLRSELKVPRSQIKQDFFPGLA